MAGEEESKATIWPDGAEEVENIADFEFFMAGRKNQPVMKIEKEKLNEFIVVNGEGVKAVAGGATSASPTILRPGPTGANRKMEDVEGWFVNGTAAEPPVAVGEPWEAPAGKKNTNWWDGTSWSLGSSVPLPTAPLDETVQEYIDSLFDIVDNNMYVKTNNVNGKYVHLDSGIRAATGVVMNVMPISPGSTYAVYSTDFNPNALLISLRASASTDIGSTLGLVSLTSGSQLNVKTFTVPLDSTATHAFINIKLPLSNFDITDILVVNLGDIITQNSVSTIAGASVLDDGAVRKADLKGLGPLYNPTNNVPNRYVTLPGGAIGTTSTASLLNVFPVEGDTVYAVKSDNYQANSFGITFRETNNTDAGVTLGLASLNSTSDPKVKTFITPTNAKFGFITVRLPSPGFDITASVMINKGDTILEYPTVSKIGNGDIADEPARDRISDLEAKTSGIIVSPLKGLIWLLIGDSITEKNFRSNENYHFYLAQLVGGMTRYNYGISGSGFFNRYDVADTITQTGMDLISIFWGTNDWGNQNAANQKQLGTFLDTGTTTISGCINTCLTKLIAKFPITPIVLFTPLPRGNNWGLNAVNNSMGYTLKQFCDLLIKYANHFSLPILDLYSQSGLFPWNTDANDYFFKAPSLTVGDGLHPNDAGHQWLAKKIKVFLESNIKK